MLTFGFQVIATEYQEIATACGLAMTVEVGGGVPPGIEHSPCGGAKSLRTTIGDGTQAVPYMKHLDAKSRPFGRLVII